MSDRTNTITVVLDKDYRVDDCDHILNALKMVKGVVTASPNIADYVEYMALERVRRELIEKIWDIFYPKKK